MKNVSRIFILVVFANMSFAGIKSNCTISIQSIKKNGEKLNIVFHTKLKNADECRTLAHMHTKNFTPDTVSSKKVNFAWEGKSFAKHERKGMLARVTRKKFKRKNTY